MADTTPIENVLNSNEPVHKPYSVESHETPQSANTQPHKITCMEACAHCNECPMCSKLHKTDTTPYIIIIILLSLVCMTVLKKLIV